MPKIILVKSVNHSLNSWSDSDYRYELFRVGTDVIFDLTEDEVKVLENNVHYIEYGVSVIRVLEGKEKIKELIEKCQEEQRKLDKEIERQRREDEARRLSISLSSFPCLS